MWEISENLRAELTALERVEHVAEWVRLAGENKGASCADIPKGRGQPRGGINAARPGRVPGHVYEIDIPDPLPSGIALVDPVCAVASHNPNPATTHSYHHDGGQNFLLGVVDPASFGYHLMTPAMLPPGSAAIAQPPHLSKDLQTLVRAIRDAEVLVSGNLRSTWFVKRYLVY